MNKKGAGKINWWVIAVIALLVYAFVPQVNQAVNGLFGKEAAAPAPAVAPAGTPAQVIEQACGNVDTTVKFESYDSLVKGQDDATSAHRVFLNGIDIGYREDGATLEVSPGDKLNVYFFQNSTEDATNNRNKYYTVEKELVVPCKETLTLMAESYQCDNASAITIWNEDASVNTGANRQAMAADDTVTIDFEIKANSKRALGNPTINKQNKICFSYNTTYINNVELDKAKQVPAPTALNITGGYTAKCYEMPVVIDNEKFKGTLVIESTATAPAATDEFNLNIWDVDLALDNDTLEPIYDVENEDNKDMGCTRTLSPIAGAHLNETVYLS